MAEKKERSPMSKKTLPEKTFHTRNSLLTDLKDSNPHIKTVHHIFVATLICFFVNAVAQDFFKRTTTLGIAPILTGFKKLHIALIFWIGANLVTFGAFHIFHVWAKVRIHLPPKAQIFRIWDISGIILWIGYYLFSFQICTIVCKQYQLPPPTAAIILLEQVRLMMKVHAYVRSNVGRVLKYKTHSDQVLILPRFSNFLYFLFAPTLIYRDQYPRTSSTNWKFIGFRLFEIFGVIFYQSFIFHRFILPSFKDYGLRKYAWGEILLASCENSIPGMLITISAFYVTLHSTQNAFAELLRFGDREFYKEWWTCTNYSDYFRTWNVVVHDWLYTYVYKEMIEVFRTSKILAKLIVFLISAIVHEWILYNVFGFFFPALFIEFLFGGALMSFFKVPKSTALNIFFWYSLMFGSGLSVSMYTLEYYARLNVPIGDGMSWVGYLMPRWLTCDCIA